MTINKVIKWRTRLLPFFPYCYGKNYVGGEEGGREGGRGDERKMRGELMVTVSLPPSLQQLSPSLPGYQMSPQSLSFHQAAPYVHCGCGGVAASAGDAVSERRGVSAGRELSGMQPPASLLPQQRGKALVFHFFTCACACKAGLNKWDLYLWFCYNFTQDQFCYSLVQCQSSSGSVGKSIWPAFRRLRFGSWLDLIFFFSLSLNILSNHFQP